MHPLTSITADRAARYIALLTLLVLISPHWLLTRDLADGAVFSFARAAGKEENLLYWYSFSGTLIVIFYKAIFALSDLTGLTYLLFAKLAISLLVVGVYFECKKWAVDVFNLPANQATFAALLCVASPCLYTLANSTAIINLMCLWLVLWGHRLFWRDKISVRVAGIVLILVSFQMNSNLVFVLALDVVRMWRFKEKRKERLAWFSVLFVAAVLSYLNLRAAKPSMALFAEYNHLLNPFDLKSLLRIIRAVAMYLTWGVIPLTAWLSVALISLLLKPSTNMSSTSKSSMKSFFKFSLPLLFLACAAAFPYVAVGKGPPLFTLNTYGNGLTEQVLRAAYPGPLAPTWANTSGRHGFLFSIPVGLFTWMSAAWLIQKLKKHWNPLALYALLLSLALFWVLPAYVNKLKNQWAEISLIKGFRNLAVAKPGIVELNYQPVSSWLIWTTQANMILREAWGRSDHLGFFYSINAYRDDLLWQYNTLFVGSGFMRTRPMQNMSAMEDFPGADCITKYSGTLPIPTSEQLLIAGWFPDSVQAADIRLAESTCLAGRVLPNPTPNKKYIP